MNHERNAKKKGSGWEARESIIPHGTAEVTVIRKKSLTID
jgi:hypothetical protein